MLQSNNNTIMSVILRALLLRFVSTSCALALFLFQLYVIRYHQSHTLKPSHLLWEFGIANSCVCVYSVELSSHKASHFAKVNMIWAAVYTSTYIYMFLRLHYIYIQTIVLPPKWMV